MSPTDPDQFARDMAKDALKNIEAHEKVCAERQGHIIENLHDLKRGVEGLYRRFWIAAIGCISLLGSAVVGLIYIIVHH